MSTTCKYCNEEEDKQYRPGLICEHCMNFVHLICLRRQGTPGHFVCDVFFDFTCEDCSPNKTEVFQRNRFPWLNVIYLTLNHLNIHSIGISNRGYFHYKTHICSFIDRNWNLLFGNQTKQKKNWVGTIAGVLSIYNKVFFQSGSGVLGEAGWWKIQHNFSPAVAAHILQDVSKDKSKERLRKHLSIDKTLFLARVVVMGYKDLVNEDTESDPMYATIPTKKRRMDSDEISAESSSSYHDQFDSDSRPELGDDLSYDDVLGDTSFSKLQYADFDYTSAAYMPPVQSDTSSITSFQQSYFCYDSDSRSMSDQEKKTHERKQKKIQEKPVRKESLFSTELNSDGRPWEDDYKPEPGLVEMTQYEEVQLLKQVENMIPKVKDAKKKADLYRLKAKLSLRRLKRHKHLPMFDFDKAVKLLGGYMTEDARSADNIERVLDRFQKSYLMDNLCGTIASTNYGTMLLSHIEPTAFRSAYSGVTLKPYIWRDADTAPTWLKLTDELLRKTNRHIQGYEPPPRATIDYSYVQPQHIPAINSMCAQFFWPGIDLSESLQYPEFSCVVTYKRLVVGFAFLVPDAALQGAYISFVLTRPEWSRAKLASFMLYHLLQTCSSQDIMLHVSPTNPAIFLYQKFGFKVEEFIQDFYEKYYDIEYKGCRHALFLRLVR